LIYSLVKLNKSFGRHARSRQLDMLNLMRYFVAVVEEGSFTAAAKRLGKTKALLSTQMTQLETKLAVRLLHRSTRSLTVTEAGNTYWGEAKRILDDVENLGSQ
jgi:DNA-binding transcriptional LysR family regulator